MVDAMMHFMQQRRPKDVGAFVNIGLGQRHHHPRSRADDQGIDRLPRRVEFNAGKPDGMPSKLMDVSRADRLGWKAKVTIPEGLQLTYDWYLKNVSVETGAE